VDRCYAFLFLAAHAPTKPKVVNVLGGTTWGHAGGGGSRALNRIQSRIFPTAFESNQNLLVCAPTGAGKTNIAMIAVLREVGANVQHGLIQKGDFKIVYVAPMKALAAEVTATFSRRLSPLGAPPPHPCQPENNRCRSRGTWQVQGIGRPSDVSPNPPPPARLIRPSQREERHIRSTCKGSQGLRGLHSRSHAYRREGEDRHSQLSY
jgi:hypothetical protein